MRWIQQVLALVPINTSPFRVIYTTSRLRPLFNYFVFPFFSPPLYFLPTRRPIRCAELFQNAVVPCVASLLFLGCSQRSE